MPGLPLSLALPVIYSDIYRGSHKAHDQRVNAKIGNAKQDLVVIPQEFQQETGIAKQHQHDRIGQAIRRIVQPLLPDQNVNNNRYRNAGFNGLSREGVDVQRRIPNAVLEGITLAAAPEDAAVMGDALHHSGARGQELTS